MRILSGASNMPGSTSNLYTPNTSDWCILDMKTPYLNNILLNIHANNILVGGDKSIFSKIFDYFGNLFISQKENVDKSLVVASNVGGVKSYTLSCPLKYRVKKVGNLETVPVDIKLRELQLTNENISNVLSTYWPTIFTTNIINNSINFGNVTPFLTFGDFIGDYTFNVNSSGMDATNRSGIFDINKTNSSGIFDINKLLNMYTNPESNYPDIMYVDLDNYWKIHADYGGYYNTSLTLQPNEIYYRAPLTNKLFKPVYGVETTVKSGFMDSVTFSKFNFVSNYNSELDFNEILVVPDETQKTDPLIIYALGVPTASLDIYNL